MTEALSRDHETGEAKEHLDAKKVLSRKTYEFFHDIDNDELEKILNPQDVNETTDLPKVETEQPIDGLLIASQRERQFNEFDAYGTILGYQQDERARVRYDTPYGTDVEGNAPGITETQANELKSQVLAEFVEDRKELQEAAHEMGKIRGGNAELYDEAGAVLEEKITEFGEKYGLDVDEKSDINDQLISIVESYEQETAGGADTPEGREEEPQSELDVLRAKLDALSKRVEVAEARSAFLEAGLLGIVDADQNGKDPQSVAERLLKSLKDLDGQDNPQPNKADEQPTRQEEKQDVPPQRADETDQTDQEKSWLDKIRDRARNFATKRFGWISGIAKNPDGDDARRVGVGVAKYKAKRNKDKGVEVPLLDQKEKMSTKRKLVIAGIGVVAVGVAVFGPDIYDQIQSSGFEIGDLWPFGGESDATPDQSTVNEALIDTGGDVPQDPGITGAEGNGDTGGFDPSDLPPELQADVEKAMTVESGEGWYSTLDQLHIPESEQDAMLEKILNSDDPAIQEWVYRMDDGNPGIAKTGQIPAEVLAKIYSLRS